MPVRRQRLARAPNSGDDLADGQLELNAKTAPTPEQVNATAEVDRLFEAFRRGGGDRMGSSTSTGLGLSIVQSIAHAHGGTARIDSRPAGGLVVTVHIPASA